MPAAYAYDGKWARPLVKGHRRHRAEAPAEGKGKASNSRLPFFRGRHQDEWSSDEWVKLRNGLAKEKARIISFVRLRGLKKHEVIAAAKLLPQERVVAVSYSWSNQSMAEGRGVRGVLPPGILVESGLATLQMTSQLLVLLAHLRAAAACFPDYPCVFWIDQLCVPKASSAEIEEFPVIYEHAAFTLAVDVKEVSILQRGWCLSEYCLSPYYLRLVHIFTWGPFPDIDDGFDRSFLDFFKI
eukprot:g21464.t1